MTLEKCIELLMMHYNDRTKDFKVVVRLDEISIGPMVTTQVDNIWQGFDWDSGKIIIKTLDKIERPTYKVNIVTSISEHTWLDGSKSYYVVINEKITAGGELHSQEDAITNAKQLAQELGGRFDNFVWETNEYMK